MARISAHPMSPQDDVNRTKTLATGIRRVQLIFALDSNPSQTESARVAKKPHCAQKRKRNSPPEGGLSRIRVVRDQAVWPTPFTREDRRDIFRAAVFL
jgi:hypothetical protein